MTIVAEECPYCGESGRVRRVFWRQLLPWVSVRLNSARMVAIPWCWTNLPKAQNGDLPSNDSSAVLLSVSALEDLLRFVRERKRFRQFNK